MKANKTGVCIAILIVYVMVLLFVTILMRESTTKHSLFTEWFWGYKVNEPSILYRDNLINILLYVPIGCLVGLIAPRYKWLVATGVGLFLSETIECSQLIWHKGVFDVDDIFNNTVGALVGGLIVVMTLWIRGKKNKCRSNEKLNQHP